MGVDAPIKHFKFMKKISFLFMLCMIVCSLGAFAQLTIGSNGNVGIDAPNPVSRFSLGDVGSIDSKMYIKNSNTSGTQKGLNVQQTPSSGTWSIGVASYILSSSSSSKLTGVYCNSYKTTPYSGGKSFGLYAIAGNATSGYNYAVHGLLNGTNNGSAIFGATDGKNEAYIDGIFAGYFRGKVYVEDNLGVGLTNPAYKLEVNGDINAIGYVRSNGVVLTSDSTKKTDIRALKNGNLSKLNSLKVVTFKYQQSEFISERQVMRMAQDTGKVESSLPSLIPDSELFQQTQIGLLAQDIQRVYPELVVADKQGALGINYTGLVAVLVAAMKEQQAEIEALKQKIGK